MIKNKKEIPEEPFEKNAGMPHLGYYPNAYFQGHLCYYNTMSSGKLLNRCSRP